MRRSSSRIFAAADPAGNAEAVREFALEARNQNAGAVALLGNLTSKNADAREYARVLRALAEAQLPAFYIPGPDDAPFSEFLREAANFELVYRNVRGIHGSFTMDPKHVLWSGMGGTIEDARVQTREEIEMLRYPGWEVEYRLKFLQELKEYQRVFLFTTVPEHKGMHQKGSSVLAEIIKTYNPRLVIVGGQEQKHATIGRSLMVAPGSLNQGNFITVNLPTHELIAGSLERLKKAA